MTRQLIVGGVATLIAVAYFIGGRGYPWPLALMIGTAVGALVFS